MNNIQETDWSYLAGLIDGEGYLNILLHASPSTRKIGRRYTRDFILTISNTSRSLLVSIQSTLGTGCIYEHKRNKENNAASVYSLRFNHNTLRLILPNIIPYLRLKKQPAQIMLEELNIIKTVKQAHREIIMLEKDNEFAKIIATTRTPYTKRNPKRKLENKEYIEKMVKQVTGQSMLQIA